MKPDHNGCPSESQKLKQAQNHKTLKQYSLQMNVRETLVKLQLVFKHINGVTSGQPLLLDMNTKRKPATTGQEALLTD